MCSDSGRWIGLAFLLALTACGVSDGHSGAEIRYLNVVVVANQGSDDLNVYKLNTSTGALAVVGSYSVGSSPQAVAASADGQFVFVANQGSSTLSRFRVDSTTGALSGGETTSVESGPSALAVHPESPYLFVAHATAGSVGTYRIDSETGELSSVGSVALAGGASPGALAVDRNQGILYSLNRGLNTIQSFSMDSSSGALTSLGTASTGIYPTGVSVSSDGGWVFVSNFGDGTVSVYQSSGGVLSAVGSPATTGGGPKAIVQSADGRFLYTIDSTGNSISPLGVDSSSGGLTLGQSVSVDPGGAAAWMEPEGRYFLMTHSGYGNQVSVFSVDSTSGALTAVTTRAAGSLPVAIAVARVPLER